ncbi:microprocessor complex subunit partner of drosha isoform X2 [Brevipalpus obovatus]|uniref:microprocessor complex subunit partner of drosha isoform X2 n=1 Tax=Brevipalpus obovatus TaxID=246614 RepID=UPI003D9E9D90
MSSNEEDDVMDQRFEDDDDKSDSEDDKNLEYNIPLDDLDEMLEEGLLKNLERKEASSSDALPIPEERTKTVLKKREQDYFEILPEGWIEVTHFSGMPVYLHKQTRVCAMAKPYHLGPGSARKHKIPVSAIPCLAYKRELEKEQDNVKKSTEEPKENLTDGRDIIPNIGSSQLAKVESVQEATREKSLDHLSIREYCKKVFEFEDITIRKFKTWADRRNYIQMRKIQQRPSLPEGTKLITCPSKGSEVGEGPGRIAKKEFVMNPAGKSSVCILHEFIQHAERVQPKYVFKELENAGQPYSATVIINDMEYGVGYGSSKKQAKSEAAKATLEILIPDIKEITQNESREEDSSAQDLNFFDDIKVEDPRVSEMCAKAGQHSPYQILVECLKRNYGMGDIEIKHDVTLVKHQRIEFTMTVGKHTATVICRNKREGKQRAAQAILQLLHPQISSWGSLLRLYGRGSCKTPKEKKEEEQKITQLQNTACANRPNYAILKKLKEEMLKLKDLRENKEPLRLIHVISSMDTTS